MMLLSNPLVVLFGVPQPIHQLLKLPGERLARDFVVPGAQRTSEPPHERDALELRGELA